MRVQETAGGAKITKGPAARRKPLSEDQRGFQSPARSLYDITCIFFHTLRYQYAKPATRVYPHIICEFEMMNFMYIYLQSIIFMMTFFKINYRLSGERASEKQNCSVKSICGKIFLLDILFPWHIRLYYYTNLSYFFLIFQNPNFIFLTSINWKIF